MKILEPRVHRAIHHKNSPPQYFDWFVGTVRNVLSDWRQAAQPVSVARASVSAEALEDLASAFDPCSQAYDPDTTIQPKPVREGWFDQFFWRKYPRKLGRNKTRDLFVEEVSNYRTFQRVMLGLWAQHRELDRAPEEAHGTLCPPAYDWIDGRHWEEEPPLENVSDHARGKYLEWLAGQVPPPTNLKAKYQGASVWATGLRAYEETA